MNLGGIRRPKVLLLAPVLSVLSIIIACGGTSATSTPEAQGEAPTPTPFRTIVVSAGDTAGAQPTAIVAAAVTPVPEATEVSAPAMQVKTGGIVPMHSYSAPVTARPLIESTYSHLINLSPLYNGIMIYDPETADPDDIVCDICTGWDVSEDGKTFVYRIHPDAVWSDGVPLTADDIVFTLESIVDPDQFDPLWEGHKLRSHSGLVKPYYESSRAIDDKTWEVTLNSPPTTGIPLLAFPHQKSRPSTLYWARESCRA